MSLFPVILMCTHMYRTCTFRHLEDLEVVPHPRGEILSSMNSSNKPRSRKREKTQKPRIRPVFYYVFSQFYQKSNMILWSIRTFGYKGSTQNKKRKHVPEKRYISQTQQPKSQSMIFQKSSDMA